MSLWFALGSNKDLRDSISYYAFFWMKKLRLRDPSEVTCPESCRNRWVIGIGIKVPAKQGLLGQG